MMIDSNSRKILKRGIILIFLILLPFTLLSCAVIVPEEVKEINSRFIIEKKDGHYGYNLKIDITDQVLGLHISDYNENKKLIPPSQLIDHINRASFMSASIISAKAKQFDDGLYAAVEIAVQEGLGDIKSKKIFLSEIYKALEELEDGEDTVLSRAFILSASELGGQEIKSDKKTINLSKDLKEKFLKDPLKSKPMGFYTWNKELEQIFQQDMFLQTVLASPYPLQNPVPLAEAIVNANEEDTYLKYLDFYYKLTNPVASYKNLKDLKEFVKTVSENEKPLIKDYSYSLFPPSRSYENEIFWDYFGDGSPIPDNFNLMDELIKKIKSGSIDITPKKNSGWYDYQTYSIEPLIVPDKFQEAEKLKLSEEYREELLNFARSLLALMRETHIEELEEDEGTSEDGDEEITVEITPELSIEPLISYYLRRAESYGFIHKVLSDAFGKESLKEIHRLTPNGSVEKNLEEELVYMETLFYGAAELASLELGFHLKLPDKYTPPESKEKSLEIIKEWLKYTGKDPDIYRDTRMMVPIFYDIDKNKIKVWALLGYEEKDLYIYFNKAPEVTIFDKNGKKIELDEWNLYFIGTSKSIIYPVFAEVYVDKILNRQEFRELCDKYKTRSEIIEALQKL